MHASLASGEKITQRIRDMLAPIVTASKADLAPDSQRFIAHCKWLLSQNCGLAVFGTNSEANSLSMEERAMPARRSSSRSVLHSSIYFPSSLRNWFFGR